MSRFDMARALKDKTYFNSLSEEDKAKVRAANPAGESSLGDTDLDSVSGGLGGGESADATTTSTNTACTCSSTKLEGESGDLGVAPVDTGGCSCSC